MESTANKEQSERCLEIAQNKIQEGDRTGALRFLRKAVRLNPANSAAAELISQLEEVDMRNGGSYDFTEPETHPRNRCHSKSRFNSDFSQSHNNHSAGCSAESAKRDHETDESGGRQQNHHRSKHSPKIRKRTTSSSPHSSHGHHKSASQPQLGVDYSLEQVEMVQRVRKCKDYYECLNVSKDFSDLELKKQYRKLALQFHPDKNRAPGATEAFKAIGNAYGVLSDSKKRERYDMYGTADTNPAASRQNHYYEYDYTRGFESDMTAEEIFNMFFGGGFPQGNLRRRTGHHFHQSSDRDQTSESNFGVLLQLMPILILVILSVFSQLFVSDPPFSLSRTQKYTEERRTPELNVVYYVKSEFLKNFQNHLPRIEREVEEEYMENLRVACHRERARKESTLLSARFYSDASLYEKAQQMTTPSCDRLAAIYRKYEL